MACLLKRVRAASGEKKRLGPLWQRVLQAVGGRFLVYLMQLVIDATRSLLNSDWLMMAPIMVLFTITSADFLVLSTWNGGSDLLFFAELGNSGSGS